MGRAMTIGLAICFAAGLAWAQEDRQSDNKTVLGGGNSQLANGANAIRHGSYDEGIRLTILGLERASNSDHDRAAALSNLCAAYAAKNMPDKALEMCSQSLAIN